jgi:hypothetical protein
MRIRYRIHAGSTFDTDLKLLDVIQMPAILEL